MSENREVENNDNYVLEVAMIAIHAYNQIWNKNYLSAKFRRIRVDIWHLNIIRVGQIKRTDFA